MRIAARDLHHVRAELLAEHLEFRHALDLQGPTADSDFERLDRHRKLLRRIVIVFYTRDLLILKFQAALPSAERIFAVKLSGSGS
jgi:hypothetical protein